MGRGNAKDLTRILTLADMPYNFQEDPAFMNFKKLALALTALAIGLCTLAAADNKPKIPKVKPAAHERQNSAVRAEDKADEQRAAQLKREEEELLHQAEQKHQQAKALIQQEKSLRGQEVSQEHQEKADKNKKDHRVLAGEIKHEGSERSQLSHQAEALEKERESLTRQANEKTRERKAIEAQIRANNGRRQ